MLLWLVVALGFAACVIAWHLWQGITWEEVATLFVVSALVFAVNLHTIYREATTDRYLISGYVTSLIHRPPFDYNCDNHGCSHEPERWIIEQRPRLPQVARNITRTIHHGDGMEYCRGECRISYPAPYSATFCCKEGFAYTSILVSPAKLRRSNLGNSSVIWRPYYNPIMASDEVVYDGVKTVIPYFQTGDFNRAHRIVAPGATSAQQEQLEKINAGFSPQNISIGLIITSDNLYFEKLKRAWHQGKANDFVIVVNSPDGKAIRNVNVLGWDNYTLRENMAEAIMGLPSANIDGLLAVMDKTLRQGPEFTPANFYKYNFLDVKIPQKYYWKVLVFQMVLFVYMIALLKYNPNTKDRKLRWDQVARMWEKHYTPPESSWYLHPFTPSGILLYIIIPGVAVMICI